MEYTKNYHLPQWVKSDRIMMDDFNQMSKDIDAGLTTAVATADDARDTAASAKQIAQQAAAARPYMVGYYVGRGVDVTVYTGFRPSFVILSGMRGSNSNLTSESYDRSFAMTGGHAMSSWITFTDTGFTVKETATLPYLCESGRSYDYIAFK